MLKLPDKYKVGKKVPMKSLIPKELKQDTKKKIREYVKGVNLSYQIMGEDIPSLVNDEYNFQVIQFYDFQLDDIKRAIFIANIYQEIIKSPCILRLYDNNKEVYSLGLKRLNQMDGEEIVVTDKIITEPYSVALPSYDRNTLLKELAYDNIKNRDNKVYFYFEMYLRAYILINDKLYAGTKDFLDKPIWYSIDKSKEVYDLLRTVETKKEKVQRTISNSEKIKLNQDIRQAINKLDKI